MIYGYCRISTRKQSMARQLKNIKKEYPDARIVTEVFTGTRMDRPEWKTLEKNLKKGDTVVFDEVSRMSRNAEEGFALYKQLYEKGVSLVFLKEPHVNTESYQTALKGAVTHTDVQSGDADADKLLNTILAAVTDFMMSKVENDIQTAFRQSQKEVEYLRQRTKEGIREARASGKQIGSAKGSTYHTKKEDATMKGIKKYSKTFDGSLSDVDCIRLLNVSRNSYYKYKRKLLDGSTKGIGSESKSE